MQAQCGHQLLDAVRQKSNIAALFDLLYKWDSEEKNKGGYIDVKNRDCSDKTE